MSKRMMALAVTVAMIFCLAAPALGLAVLGVPVKVFIDEKELILKDNAAAYALVYAVSEGYGTLEVRYPVRSIVEALNGTVEWDSDTETAIVKIGEISIILPEDSYYGTVTSSEWQEPYEFFHQRVEDGVMYVTNYSALFYWISEDYKIDDDNNLHITSMKDDFIPKTSAKDKVILNGEQLVLPEGTKVIRYENYPYVPLRCVMEKLGATVTWDEEKKVAIVARGDAKFTVNLVDEPPYPYVICEKNGQKIDEGYLLGELKNGTIYLHIKGMIADLMDISVDYDADTGAVIIDTK